MQQEPVINRHGNCPACDKKWDDGEMVERLRGMEVFMNKTNSEIEKLAMSFGWTEENKAHFSKVVVHELNGNIYYMCPEMRCGHVFNAMTGQEFNSFFDVQLQETMPEEILEAIMDTNLKAEIEAYATVIEHTEKAISEAVGISQSLLGKPQAHEHTTGSFGQFGQVLEQGKRKTNQGLSTDGATGDT